MNNIEITKNYIVYKCNAATISRNDSLTRKIIKEQGFHSAMDKHFVFANLTKLDTIRFQVFRRGNLPGSCSLNYSSHSVLAVFH